MAKKQKVKKPYGRYSADLARIRSFFKDKLLDTKYDKEMADKLAAKAKRIAKINKKIAAMGGKTLGLLGLMGAGALSASAGNVTEKSEGEQIRDLLTKHNLKGQEKKKGGKKYRNGGFKDTFLEPGIESID